ncbi:MAG: hypothetical protein RXR20_36605 [Paraburkholderia sp.]|jgi:hypothetical protein|uniref:hypothetical protein n=1 Tax=Burkholderiaceae TaxID=119060 RepID=UPI001484C9B0|nr:hypothetical protein [Burkholderia sp. 4M9327F10]
MVQLLSSGGARLARDAQIVFGGNVARKLVGFAILAAGYALIASHALQHLPGR